ncbi:MAG: mechanosensitive ion channel [Proteobacteria bacterium]|nr:mechanosensitive ion channel [Pseudomonadota bacterium]
MNNLYYGNTVLAWITAGGLILVSLVLGKTLYWVFKNVCGPILRKSGRKLFGIIIDMIEEPIVFMAVIVGIRYSLKTLTLSDEIAQNADYALSFVITLTITWLVIRLYNSLHQRYFVPLAEKTATSLDDHLLPLFRKGLNAILWTIGIIVALNNAGYNITPVLAGLGIGGLAFALSVQHTFGNILSGLLIYTDGHFKVGDRIQLRSERADIDGIVTDIGLRTSTVKTRYEGRYVNIPNSFLTNRDVVNVETENGRQLFAVYKLTHDTTAEEIQNFIKMIGDAVKTTAGTKETVVTGLIAVSEIALDVMLLYWIDDDASKIKTRTEINLKILEGMASQDITFSDRTIITYNKDIQY